MQSKNLPSLDGLRALSILLVLIAHLNGTSYFPLQVRHFPVVGNIGHLGVNVFFIISGFLITTLLIKEYKKTGRVSLKLFYARRALRIFPASYAFLCVVFLLDRTGVLHLMGTDLWFATTYTMNYSVNHSWYVGHLWSLSIEEQFYLLWPFAFSRFGPDRAVGIASCVMIAAAVARFILLLLFRGTPYFDLETFPTVADSLAVGCLLACRRDWLERERWYLLLFRPAIASAILAGVILMNGLVNYTLIFPLGMTFINLGIAVLVHRCVYAWDRGIGRLLNWKPLAFVGTLSYSLYLWQQLFLNRESHSFEAAFPQNLAFACCAALLSYTVLEKPLMKLRHRLRVTE
jgi:peptidoglycan/LPS O-acetylase OafA/YrhL